MTKETFTTDYAREAWASSGLKYEDLNVKDLFHLRNYINQELTDHEPLRNTLKCDRVIKYNFDNDGDLEDFYITCRAFYFKQREAVSFNEGGFIGFAGWSDNTNIQPILRGFLNWLDDIT